MRTFEKVAADVLERRDRYLAAQAEKRKAAKRYTAAGVLILVSVLAAAGLFRSALADPGQKTVRPYENTRSGGRVPSEVSELSAETSDTKMRETTAASRETDAAQTTGKGTRSTTGGRSFYETAPTTAARTEMPATRNKPETAVPTTEKPDCQPGPSETESAQSTQPSAAPATDRAACADPPADSAAAGEPVSVGGDDLSLLGEPDEMTAVSTQITLLLLPSGDARTQLGAQLPGTGEMYALEYAGAEEELFPADEN